MSSIVKITKIASRASIVYQFLVFFLWFECLFVSYQSHGALNSSKLINVEYLVSDFKKKTPKVNVVYRSPMRSLHFCFYPLA